MTREVRACTVHDSLNAAARVMWDHDCGCVPVVDSHGRLGGIVTDRDISMAAYTQGVPLEAIPLERVMAGRVISCARGDDVETAHRLMRTHEIHRLPVVDSRGRLVGILSLSDVAIRRAKLARSRRTRSNSWRLFPRLADGVRPQSTVASESSRMATATDVDKAAEKTVTQRRKPSADRP